MPLLPVKHSTGPMLVIAASVLLVVGSVWVMTVQPRSPASVEATPVDTEAPSSSPLPAAEAD